MRIDSISCMIYNLRNSRNFTIKGKWHFSPVKFQPTLFSLLEENVGNLFLPSTIFCYLNKKYNLLR